jgi:hypothetical protein
MAILVIKALNTKFRIMASQARIENFGLSLLSSDCNLSVVANVLVATLFDLKRRVNSADFELVLVDLEYVINFSSYLSNQQIDLHGDLDGDFVWDFFNLEISIEV